MCSLYDQIFKPSKFPANADFHLFKTGVEPKWEDPECANGGKWTVTSSKRGNLDTMWLETVRKPYPSLLVTESVINTPKDFVFKLIKFLQFNLLTSMFLFIS